jgi:hypothetical protein
MASADRQLRLAEAEYQKACEVLESVKKELEAADRTIDEAVAAFEANTDDDAAWERVTAARAASDRIELKFHRAKKLEATAKEALRMAEEATLGVELDKLAPQVTEAAYLARMRPHVARLVTLEREVADITRRISADHLAHQALYTRASELAKKLKRDVSLESAEHVSLNACVLARRIIGEIQLRFGETHPGSAGTVQFTPHYQYLAGVGLEGMKAMMGAGVEPRPAALALVDEIANTFTASEQPLAAE